MAEDNTTPETFDDKNINPITGQPFVLPSSGGSTIKNLDSYLGIDRKPTIGHNGKPISKENQRAFDDNLSNFSLEPEGFLSQVNPITGQSYDNTKTFKVYDGVNRGHFTGTKEIENLHSQKDSSLTASALMNMGLTPTTENDWEDMRAQKQGWGEKALYGTGRMIVTAGTTLTETLFGSATGAANFALAGTNKETKRAVDSYIEGKNKSIEEIEAGEGKLGLMSLLESISLGQGSVVNPYVSTAGESIDTDGDGISDTTRLVKADASEQELEAELRRSLENDVELMSSLRDQGMTVDDAVIAIKQEKYEKGYLDRWGDNISSALGGKIGYDSPGGLGSVAKLAKYKAAVQKTVETKSGPGAWNDIAAAYWDTPLGNAMDDLRDAANESLPMYYTRKEQDSDEINWVPFEEGSANFYFDKVFNGIGFAAGAFAPMYLTKGKGGAATVYRGARNLFTRGVKAERIAAGLTEAAAAEEATVAGGGAAAARVEQQLQTAKTGTKKIQDAAKLLVSSYAASYSEAAVESRDVKKQYIEARVAEWEAANPGKSRNLIPPDEMEEIERYANTAGNTNFAMQMPILIGTNMFTLSMLMGGSLLGKFRLPSMVSNLGSKLGVGAEETIKAGKIVGAAGSATEATWFTSKAGKIAEKAIRRAAPLAKGAAFEGGQELAQYFSQQFNLSYWHARQTDDIASASEHMANAFKKTFTDKEGLEQGLIGAMIGGGMTALSARGQNKNQKQATEKLLAIRNSGVLSKITQRAEMSSETQAMMEDYHKETSKGNHSRASEILSKALAHEARIAEEFGGGELYQEMLNDMEKMSPEDFTKYALPHLGEEAAKSFTQEDVKNTVKEVRDGLNRNIQIAKNVKEMFPVQEKSSPVERWMMSEEQRNNEDLQIRVNEAYRNMLYHSAVEMKDHDIKIDNLVDKVNKKLQDGGMPLLDPNQLRFSIKTGRVTVGEDGKVTIASIEDVLGLTRTKNDLESEKLFLRALDPQDREEIQNAFNEMYSIAERREQAVQAYEELRKNPDKRTLYYEALQADQTENTKARRDAVARRLIMEAKTADELINSLPNITDEDLKQRALGQIKTLRSKQSKIRKDKFSDMSVEEMRNLDYDGLSKIEQAAYNESLRFKKNSEIRIGIKNKVNNILDQSDDQAYEINALFKAMNREKAGDQIIPAIAKQMEIELEQGLHEPVVVVGMAVYYDKGAKKLRLIVEYQLQSDPSKTGRVADDIENIVGLDKFESRLKEIMANDISAKKTTEALTPKDEVDDLGQRILEEEQRTADSTVRQAKDMVTNVDTEIVEVEGIRTHIPTGRGFLIGGRRYENTGITIMDAVNLSPDGEVSSITLFDVEKQEYYTFRKRRGAEEVEVINAIYEQILIAADCRAYLSQAPTMTEEETQEVQKDREETIKTITDDIITQEFTLPLEVISTEVLKQQQVRLDSAIRELNAILDSYYADYYALGYTNAEANNDETVKKLKGLIAGMQKMHNSRRAALIDRGEKIQLQVGAFQDEITKLSKEIDDLDEANEKLAKDVADNQELLDSGIVATNTAEGVQQLAQLQQDIAAAKQVISYNEKKIQNKTKQIKTYNNEIDILMGRRTVSAEGTQEAAAGQITEEQSQRAGETSEDTGLDEVGNEPGEVEARLQAEKEAAEQMSNQTESNQAGGQLNVSGNVELQFSPQHTTDSTASTMSVQLDIQLAKGEFTTNDNWKVLAEVDENGISIGRANDLTIKSRIVVNSKGEEIGRINVDRKALGNPNVAKPGTKVIFEVREDTQWWQEEGRDSLPEDRHWEKVPIFVKIVEEKPNGAGEIIKVETYVGLLTSYKQDANDGFKGNTRKIIYETVKNGGTATSTIKSKRLSTGKGGNIINLRTADTKDATGKIIPGQVVFVNPASEGGLGRRFVKGVPTSATPIVALAVGVETKDAQGNVTDISRRWELGNTKGLLPEELAKISYALDQAMSNYDTLTDAGVVAFLIQDPNGNYRVVQGSTRFLTQEAQDAAIAALKNRDVNTFNQIVGTNKIKASTPNYMYVEEVSKNWGATEGKNGIRVTFWSPAAKSLVSVQYDKLLTAIEQYKASGKAELAFSFTVVEQTEEGGKDFKSASREKAEFDVLKNVMVKEFLDQLAEKRFQVSKALLETNAEYTSPINPERTYSSYTDYLFSETEAQEQRKEGLGSKAILTSDVANNGYGSVFFDIGLEFGTIESNGVQMEVKEEMRAQAFDQPTNTPAPAANTVTADINLELPALPGMPGAPTVAPTTAPTATPTTTATDDFVPIVYPMDTDAKTDTKRRSEESTTDFINRLFENNYFTEVDGKQLFALTGGRWGVVVNVNGINIPFYQSTSGTDTKITGQWYPFFGDMGNWVIKGNSDNSNIGYGFKAIQDVQSFLNDNIKETDAIALSDIIPTEINQNKENFRKLDESQIKNNDNLSISKEATAKRFSKLLGYTVEEARKTKSDAELFALASKKIFAELAALEGKPATTTPATQPAPAATTTNSAITPVKVTTKDNVMLYEKLRDSSDLRDKEKVSELTRVAEVQAREELMKEAKQTMKGRLLGVSEPTTEAIKQRAAKIAERIIAAAVAPSNTGEIMFNIHDVLGGWSKKHGNTTEHANYDNRYSWQSSFSPYSYVGFTKNGNRALVVVMPNTDTSNVTRPGMATSISILLPNNVSSAYLASSIISKAKEVAAQARLSGTDVTSKILMDSILPVVKEGFTGVKQQTKPSGIPAAVEESFRLQLEQKEKEEKNKKEKEVVEVDQWKTHTVKKGETLKSLAIKYGTSVAEIKQWNNLKSNFLTPGKNLKIKFKVKKTVENPISTPASTPTASTTASEGMTLAELEKFLEDNPGTEITTDIAQQISDETAPNLMDEYGEDSVSLQDDMIEILGLPYPKSEVNAQLLIGLGISPQEANEILKNIC